MELKIKFLDENIDYDGSQLSAHFGYKNFEILGDSLIAFEGKCNIPQSQMADLEDIVDDEEIYSDGMLHFIGEFFSASLEEVILYQRIFASIIQDEVFKNTNKLLIRDGDDLFFTKGRKLSISIATKTGVSTMFHFGMNTDSKNTPVDTISLEEIGIDNIHFFTYKILEKFKTELMSAGLAKCKVRMK
ncbi:MAG: DUF366 family protein [Candidatus Muiribacteriota bacterium]